MSKEVIWTEHAQSYLGRIYESPTPPIKAGVSPLCASFAPVNYEGSMTRIEWAIDLIDRNFFSL